MVWSQYRNEAELTVTSHHNNDTNYDENLPNDTELGYEDWKTWHSLDLLNMWHSITSYVSDTCIHNDIMNFSDYDDFCTFIYEHSTKHKSKNAS